MGSRAASIGDPLYVVQNRTVHARAAYSGNRTLPLHAGSEAVAAGVAEDEEGLDPGIAGAAEGDVGVPGVLAGVVVAAEHQHARQYTTVSVMS